MGHEVRVTYDGSEAVAAVTTFRPHLVFLDIGMPRLNGYEAARRIRERSGGRQVRLVALTGWAQDRDRLRSAEAGFDLHLVKPISRTTLEDVLGSGDRAGRPESPANPGSPDPEPGPEG
jgi:CheY-like chemotaxis protein